jgi:hypothetical protein
LWADVVAQHLVEQCGQKVLKLEVDLMVRSGHTSLRIDFSTRLNTYYGSQNPKCSMALHRSGFWGKERLGLSGDDLRENQIVALFIDPLCS